MTVARVAGDSALTYRGGREVRYLKKAAVAV